jgi:hypothetical protein
MRSSAFEQLWGDKNAALYKLNGYKLNDRPTEATLRPGR